MKTPRIAFQAKRFDFRGQFTNDRIAKENAVVRAEMVAQQAIQRYEAKINGGVKCCKPATCKQSFAK